MADDKKLGISSFQRAISIPGMLLFGTATIVSSKIMYQEKAKNRHGDVVYFKKPFLQVYGMFLGMCLCLIIYYIQTVLARRAKKAAGEKDALIDKSEEKPVAGAAQAGFFKRNKSYFMIAIPTCCDLTATGLMSVGLLWLAASIFQLLRGSMVVFSAVFSVLLLKRKLHYFNLFGIFLVVSAMVLVGVAAIESAEGDQQQATPFQVTMGIILVVGAQVIQAGQIVIEEFLLKDCVLPPALIVGVEGSWGLAICVVILFPILQNIPHGEDTIDTFIMIGNSLACGMVVLIYVLAVLFYNLFGMMVTQQYTAVHRTILEAVRTSCIWLTDVFIYYVISKQFGEDWNVWSYLQLAGLLLLVVGTFVYNRIFELPCFYYPPLYRNIQG